MFELSKKPQTIEGVIVSSVKLYVYAFKRLMPLAFLYALIVVLPNMLLHVEWPQTLEGFNKASIIYAVILFACNVFGIWLIAIIFDQAYQLMVNQKVGYFASMLNALYRLPLFIIAGFIFIVLCFFGGLFFIYPGIYLYFLLMFYFIFILIEHKSIGASFQLSAELVWSHWFRTFVVLLPLIIVIGIVILISETLFNLPLVHLSRFHHTEMSLLTHGFTILLVTLVNPWFATLLLSQFYDLKLRKNNA